MNKSMDFDFEDIGDLELQDSNLAFEGFLFDEISTITPVDTCHITVNRYPRPSPVAVSYEKAEDLAKQIPALDNGVSVYAIVSGNFIFGDFLEALIVEKNWFVDELYISTLSLSQENVDSLKNLQAGNYLGKLGLIVSDYWYAHERRKIVEYHTFLMFSVVIIFVLLRLVCIQK